MIHYFSTSLFQIDYKQFLITKDKEKKLFEEMYVIQWWPSHSTLKAKQQI